ncbi:MAG: hypothetical protein D084_Lepto4C00188G0004, partial [Leptospirillum sp. Group IV 'UBA BS']
MKEVGGCRPPFPPHGGVHGGD